MSATITINGSAGSNVTLPIGVLCQLNNQNAGGETTFTWSIVTQPAGPADALSATNIQNPTFTPQKEGTYLIQLTVNAGMDGEDTDREVAGIPDLKTGQRIPAAQETTQTSNTLGWAQAVDPLLQENLNRMSRNGGIVTAKASGAFTYGVTVGLVSSAIIKAGLPGQETIPQISQLQGNSGPNTRQTAGIMLGPVGSDGSNCSAGDLVDVLIEGLWTSVTVDAANTWNVNDPVYLSNTGTLARDPGTNPRQVARVVSIDTTGGTQRITVWLHGLLPPLEPIFMEYQGTVAAASQVIWRGTVGQATITGINAAGSSATCGTPPSSGNVAIFGVLAGTTSLGTVAFDDTGSASFVFAARHIILSGSVLTLVANGDPHGISDVAVTLVVG